MQPRRSNGHTNGNSSNSVGTDGADGCCTGRKCSSPTSTAELMISIYGTLTYARSNPSDSVLSQRRLLPAFCRGPLKAHPREDGIPRVFSARRGAPPLSWLVRWPHIRQRCGVGCRSGLCGPHCFVGVPQVIPSTRVRVVNRRLPTCRATASTVTSGAAEARSLPVPPPATSLPVCAESRHPLGCSAVFQAARRWINASRSVRGAPTAEARLRILMQLAVAGHSDDSLSKVAKVSPLLEIQRAMGLRTVTSGSLETEPALRGETSVAPLSSGTTLFDAPLSVSGCAAAAAVRVALHFPTKIQQDSMTNRMSASSCRHLCCSAGRRGARLYVWGESDSLVVGGLLQLLSRSLSGGPPCLASSLAALGPSKLLRRCNLLELLPDSRIRGFRRAVELILGSTCSLLRRCDVVSLLGKGGSDFDGVEGGGPEGSVGAYSAASTPGCLEEKPPTTTATATVPIAATTATSSVEASDAPTGSSRTSLRDVSNPSTLTVKSRGLNLGQHGETALLMERSRAALPLGGGVGSEVHVLVSGGVDSAVSLLLMREWGFRPKPVFLKVWAPEAAQLEKRLHTQQHQGTLSVAAAAAAAAAACPWREDAEAAAAVAAAADLSLEVLPMQQQYWDRVITSFVEGARAGLTLNPDWSCNSLVKFGAFVETLGDLDYPVVSGHYAMVQKGEGAPRLLRGKDLAKDQSYFLSGLSLQQLSRVLFPVGALLKTQVRKLAAEWNLPPSQRPDSQGLCFLGPLPVGHFLMYLLGEKEGPIYHFPSGTLVGRHKGLWAFTTGQQKGVLPLLDPRLCRRCRGAAGGPPTLSGPWSVVGKVPEANALFVVSKEEERAAEDCVRTLVSDAVDSHKCHDGLLEAAAKVDRRALLALKLRQLRTCLRVDNIRWLRGETPPEFAAAMVAQGTSFRSEGSAAAAVAANAVAAAKEGDPVLVGNPPNGGLKKDANGNSGLIVQVRHSAGFHGVAKHRFKVLWSSKGPSHDLSGRLSGNSSQFSASHEDAELLLEEPDVGLAPGQIAAFYRGDECIGSARISALQGLPVLKGILEKGN